MTTAFKVTISALLLLTLAQPLVAQFNPYSPSLPGNNDPRARRAMRERAVAYAGDASREFIETQGEPAVVAIFACSQDGARKLVEFHNSGKLAKLPRPAELLRVIAMPGHGDDVVIFAMQHETELTDVDHFDAYLLSPLDYAYSLRKLSEGAAEARARRLSGQAAPWQYTLDGRTVGVGVSILGLLLLLWWRSRRGG
jgi:hypothetical protein